MSLAERPPLKQDRGEGEHRREACQQRHPEGPALQAPQDNGRQPVPDEQRAVHRTGNLYAEFGGPGDPFEIHAGEERSPAKGFGHRQQAEGADDGGRGREFHRRLRLL
jgi:hypothetical protein